MISKKMAEELSKLINDELYSSYLYLSMASHSDSLGLKGLSNWFHVQVQEEIYHAQKFYKYVLNQGEKVILETIAKPPSDFKSPLDLFEKTLEHERSVTLSVNRVFDLAKKENDNATSIMLQWFVTEQIEEEANASEIIQQLKLIGNDGSGLFMIDNQLSSRTFTTPESTS